MAWHLMVPGHLTDAAVWASLVWYMDRHLNDGPYIILNLPKRLRYTTATFFDNSFTWIGKLYFGSFFSVIREHLDKGCCVPSYRLTEMILVFRAFCRKLTCVLGLDTLGESGHDLVLHDGVTQVHEVQHHDQLPYLSGLTLKYIMETFNFLWGQ